MLTAISVSFKQEHKQTFVIARYRLFIKYIIQFLSCRNISKLFHIVDKITIYCTVLCCSDVLFMHCLYAMSSYWSCLTAKILASGTSSKPSCIEFMANFLACEHISESKSTTYFTGNCSLP